MPKHLFERAETKVENLSVEVLVKGLKIYLL